jgi:hypothetical protein
MKLLTLLSMTAITSLQGANLYDHKLKTIDGEDTSLSEHPGQSHSNGKCRIKVWIYPTVQRPGRTLYKIQGQGAGHMRFPL